MMIYYLSYVSTAIKPLSENELLAYLTKFRASNIHNDVSGMLLYIEGTFIQTIEGKKEDVENLYAKIEKDVRHKDINKVLCGYWKERKFLKWSMAFRSVSILEANKITGFSNISDLSLLNSEDTNENHPALRLLQSFYEQILLHQKPTDKTSEN